MEFSTVLKKNLCSDFLHHGCSCLKLLGPLFGHSVAGRLALDDYDFSSCWTPSFLSFQRPQSFKKGSAAVFRGSACRHVLFANCWAPFRSQRPQRPNFVKKGSGSLFFGLA